MRRYLPYLFVLVALLFGVSAEAVPSRLAVPPSSLSEDEVTAIAVAVLRTCNPGVVDSRQWDHAFHGYSGLWYSTGTVTIANGQVFRVNLMVDDRAGGVVRERHGRPYGTGLPGCF